MNKKIIYGVFVLIVLVGIFLAFKFGPEVTTGSVGYTHQCVTPAEAVEMMNNFNCEEIEIEDCVEGLVGVRCP